MAYVARDEHAGRGFNPSQDLGAEASGLVMRAAGELCPADALREAGIVLDSRARARLAAGSQALDHGRRRPSDATWTAAVSPAGPAQMIITS